jgi:arabinofuranosyltransferase
VIGMAALAAGPEVVLVDRFALTDPLLARLPAAKPETLRPGHVARALPEGYLEARDTGDTSGMHPSLAEYWTRLRLVTAGPLLDGERLATIVRFHLGRYDHLLAEYAASE